MAAGCAAAARRSRPDAVTTGLLTVGPARGYQPENRGQASTIVLPSTTR